MAFDLHPSRWAAILAAFALFFIVLSGKVRYVHGDARYSLLTTQALLEHASPRLDPYSMRYDLSELNHGKNWMLYRDAESGHVYYDYPVGTPIFSMPFVAVARFVGMKPINKYDDADLQILMAAGLIAIVFLLLFRLSLLYLPDWGALVFAGAFTLGTTLTSTLGTALWSQNFEVIFVCLALLELATVIREERTDVRGGWLGVWLFCAYLCRPTAAPLILVVFGYLAWRHRRALPWAAGVAGTLLLFFMIWSRLEMGRWLPRYYSPDNWEPYGDYWHNLWPILYGPARGLFSFTPILVLMFAGFAVGKLRREPMFWALWGWLALLVTVVLRSKNPWGGWCYGPRFFTEIMPGLAWLLLMVFESSRDWPRAWARAFGGAAVVLGLMGIYIHTWQGLYNPLTNSWNENPNVDTHWDLVRRDWRYPQFMVTSRQLGLRVREQEMSGLVLEAMGPVPAGGALLVGPPDPDLADFFAFWNDGDLLHTGKFAFNTVQDIREAAHTEFWYMRDLHGSLQATPGLQLDPLPADSVLGPDSVRVAVPGIHLGHARLLPEPTQP